MPKIIKDEFSHLPSSVARYRARHTRDGLCIECDRKAEPNNTRCDLHNRRNNKRAKDWNDKNRSIRVRTPRLPKGY